MITLKINNLKKRYNNVFVLENLTRKTSVSILGIAGPNGSGKSTLLKCMAGLVKPTAGTVTWNLNGDSYTPAEMNGMIGFAAPYVELYEGMSVSENLAFLMQLHRDKSGFTSTDPGQLLRRFQADSFAGKPYGELSTGQRQRVKLSSAFLHNPPVILLDEPGSNLDPKGKHLIRETIQNPGDDQKMVIVASNLMEELELCEEIIDLG